MYRIPLARPTIDDAVMRSVREVLESGMLSEGRVTAELEQEMTSYLGCKHAVAVTSCTTGLELSLRALGIGPGDEVMIPDYTYPATACAPAILGARVVLVDVSPATMLIDPDALERAVSPRTRAVIPVSLFGNPLDYGRLDSLRSRGIAIVEDAACALGAELGGRKVGTFADLSVFSLHPRKFVTTGEGGLIATDRDDLAAWLRRYKRFGWSASEEVGGGRFVDVGANHKLSDVLAAIGLAQMRRVHTLRVRRLALAERYEWLLGGAEGVDLPETTPGGLHSRQSFCVHVPGRDGILRELRRRGIEAQIGTYALHREPAFRDEERFPRAGPLEGSATAWARTLALPLFDGMTDAEQEEVAGSVLELADRGLRPCAES